MSQAAELPLPDELTDEPGAVSLPTYEVLARFRSTQASEQAAVAEVSQRLSAAEEPFHEVTVERREDDGSFLVVARFVLVSVDAHTAVVGLDETLRAAALAPDEVWADHQLS